MVLSDTGVTKGWQRNQMPAYGDAVTVKFWYGSISILGVHTGDLADTVCGRQKAAVLGRDTGKALLLITLPQCLPRWFPAVKKKSFCLKSKDIFSHFSHARSLLQRKKLQFLWKWGCGWKVRGKGSKKKNCLNCSNLSSLGDWCVSFISQETGVATTPELAPDFTLLVCKISITALRT